MTVLPHLPEAVRVLLTGASAGCTFAYLNTQSII